MSIHNSHKRTPISTPSIHSSDHPNHLLLQAVTSSWNDGILILTVDGQIVYGNRAGWKILSCLYSPAETTSPRYLPQGIKQALHSLKQNCPQDSSQTVLLESELQIDPQHTYRMRVRWFEVDGTSHPHILIVLEDQYQSKYNLALAEADKYQLSSREAEVWLLHRLGYKYKQIAAELFITIHTVKKHLRNIRWKREHVENKSVA